MLKLRLNIFIALAIAVIAMTEIVRPIVAHIPSADRLFLAAALLFSAITYHVLIDNIYDQISKRKGAVIVLITIILYGLIMAILQMLLKSKPDALILALSIMITTPAVMIIKSIVDAITTTEKEQHNG